MAPEITGKPRSARVASTQETRSGTKAATIAVGFAAKPIECSENVSTFRDQKPLDVGRSIDDIALAQRRSGLADLRECQTGLLRKNLPKRAQTVFTARRNGIKKDAA